MKIFISNHRIENSQRPGLTDIPLSKIEKDIIPEKINVEKLTNFSIDTKKNIVPYTAVDNNILLFDEEQNIVPSSRIKADNDRFIYVPEELVEFKPTEFTVEATIKKNLQYDSSKSYNLKIGINESDSTFSWSKKLISIFGDAAARGICPSSISVNDRSSQITSFINTSYSDLDFVFMQSYDGKYTDSTQKTLINFDEILNKHTNIWLTISNPDKIFTASTVHIDGFKYKNPILYQNIKFPAQDKWIINPSGTVSGFPKDKNTYVYHTLFDGQAPFYVIEKPDCGFVIVSMLSFFDALQSSAAFIYETLMQIYSITYLQTKSISSWITDIPVDFIENTDQVLNRKHKKINLKDLIDQSNFSCKISDSEYSLVEITPVSDSCVILLDQRDNSNNLSFSKIIQTDPIKKNGDISIYSTRRTVIQYKKTVINQIESAVKIDTKIEKNATLDYSYYITIHPFVSSLNKIVVKTLQTFELENPEKKYFVVATPVTSDSNKESKLFLVESTKYDSTTQLAVAAVTVSYSSINTAADIRLLGGGVPIDEKYDDYDLVDIGSLKGKPYRVGTTMVIKLPKRLKPYDSIIKDAIDARKVAADAVIIQYE